MDLLSKRILYCFLGIWFVAVVVVIWNPIDFYPISSYTFLLVYLNIISFTLGFISYKIPLKRISGSNLDRLGFNIDAFINNNVFRLVLGIAILYTTSLIIKNYQTMILYESLSYTRDAYFEDAGKLYGAHFVLLRDYFLNPLAIVLIPVFAYCCYKKRIWESIFIGVFLLEHASLSGGRFDYARILFGLVFVIFCVWSKKISKRIVFAFGAVFAVFVGIIMITTMLRSGNLDISKEGINESQEDVSDQIALYIGGPIAALNYAIDNDYVNKMGGHTYGICTFNPFDHLLQPVIKFVNPQRLPASNKFIGYKQENMIRITPLTGGYNGLYTAILFFYMDFGVLGVLFLPFILGLFVRFVFYNLYKCNNVPALALASWFFGKVLYSVFDFDAVSYLPVFYFLIYYIWSRRTMNPSSDYSFS